MVASGSEFEAKAISAEEFRSRNRRPVLLHFQPENFSIIESPSDLRKWEELMVQRVGIDAKVAAAITQAASENGSSCCESGSTDDCDVD
jgi:hypothetical protein